MSYRLHILLSVKEGDVRPLPIILKALEANRDFKCYELSLCNDGSVIFAEHPNSLALFEDAVINVSRDYPAIVFKLEYSYSGGGWYTSMKTKIRNGDIIEEVEKSGSGYGNEWYERILKQGKEEVNKFHYVEVVNGEYVSKSKTYRSQDICSSSDKMVYEVFASDTEPLSKLFQRLCRVYDINDSDGRTDKYTVKIDKDRLCLVAKGFWLEDFELYVEDLIERYPEFSITWNAHY